MCGDIKSGKWMGKGYRIFWSLDGIGIPERGGMIKEFRFALPSLKGLGVTAGGRTTYLQERYRDIYSVGLAGEGILFAKNDPFWPIHWRREFYGLKNSGDL